jgi:putative FmdB family regulatory protein
MPNYEFRCLNCQRRFEVFLAYLDYGKKPIQCIHCKSENVQRRIGRVRIAKSEESRLESLADPSRLDSIDDDPKALGKMMREMSKETGEDMGPEFHEVIHRLESGQSPDQIEKDLPELANMGGGEMGGGLPGLGGSGLGDPGMSMPGGDMDDE